MQLLRIPILVLTVAWLPPISLAATDSEATDKPAASAPSTEAIHLSPQATEGPKPEPITPPKPEELSAAIERGVKFLLADQRPDGAWGSAEHSKSMNLYAPPPGRTMRFARPLLRS